MMTRKQFLEVIQKYNHFHEIMERKGFTETIVRMMKTKNDKVIVVLRNYSGKTYNHIVTVKKFYNGAHVREFHIETEDKGDVLYRMYSIEVLTKEEYEEIRKM